MDRQLSAVRGMAERKKHWLGKIDAAIGAIGK